MSTQRKKPEDLRSHRWYGAKDMRSFGTVRALRRWVTTGPIMPVSR